jgi:hypothetical protein
MGVRRGGKVWTAQTGWVRTQATEERNYSEYCNESWALLMSFFRWYPDILLDVFRAENAKYELPLIHRVILRAFARNQFVDVTGSRGLGKTTTNMQYSTIQNILWPGQKTVYTGPSYKQQAALAKAAFDDLTNDYPVIAKQYTIDNEGKDSWSISTRYGSDIGINTSRGRNFHDVTAEEVAQEEKPPFDADAYKTITLYAVRLVHMVNGKRDPTSISYRQRTITSAGRRQSFAFENRKNHFQAMMRGQSAFVVDIPWQVVVLNGIRPIEWALQRKEETTPDKWLREMESVYTGTSQNPIVRDDVLYESRKIAVMEEHHCCKDKDCKLKPEDVIYVIGYDVSSENNKGNARCAAVVVKLTRQKEFIKRDKYLKQVVYVDDWPPPEAGMMQAKRLKQLWYQFCYEGSQTYIAIDARSYGRAVVEALMMDLGDGLAPLCTIFHDDYLELEVAGALPVLYTIKATGGQNYWGAKDSDSNMIQYAEMQFENRNVQLLISNRNRGVEEYKKYHRIKDDRMDFDIDRPYRKTEELVGQIQNLKKVPSGTGVQEKRISHRIQRDSWSALKYALRLTERLELINLVIPERKNEWQEFFETLDVTHPPKSAGLTGGGSMGRLKTARRGGRLF